MLQTPNETTATPTAGEATKTSRPCTHCDETLTLGVNWLECLRKARKYICTPCRVLVSARTSARHRGTPQWIARHARNNARLSAIRRYAHMVVLSIDQREYKRLSVAKDPIALAAKAQATAIVDANPEEHYTVQDTSNYTPEKRKAVNATRKTVAGVRGYHPGLAVATSRPPPVPAEIIYTNTAEDDARALRADAKYKPRPAAPQVVADHYLYAAVDLDDNPDSEFKLGLSRFPEKRVTQSTNAFTKKAPPRIALVWKTFIGSMTRIEAERIERAVHSKLKPVFCYGDEWFYADLGQAIDAIEAHRVWSYKQA